MLLVKEVEYLPHYNNISLSYTIFVELQVGIYVHSIHTYVCISVVLCYIHVRSCGIRYM